MRVLLVNPFGSNWVEGMQDHSGTAIRMAPIGILSIAAYLVEHGHEVEVHDCRGPARRGGSDELMARVRTFRPDVVGFTGVTSSFLNANALAEEIKGIAPGTIVVMGGVHVSALRGRILEAFPAVDCLVTGEGELAMADLASGADPKSIQGLVYRDGHEISDNGLRTDLCELDSLPFPAYHKLAGFPRQYEGALFNYPKAPSAAIVSSRGCPYQCSYCDRSVYRRSFRFNSAEYLHEHVAFLKQDFGIRHVFFYDDLFTFNRERIEQFCELLRKKPLHVSFNCAVRVGHADDDLLATLKAAGCWMVSLGIESGAPEILARHKSNVDLHEMRTTVKRIQKHGLRAKGLFMMGLPGETEETIRMTSDFVESLELDDMNMTRFTPFPGSPIYATIRDEGAFDERWELMNGVNSVFVPKGIESKQRLDDHYMQFLKRFYSGKNWARKFGPLLLKCPSSGYRLLRNLPTFIRMKNDFVPKKRP
jgi:anaerobic magnesium-protoporphyrin IX monomethyl ester cyclase